ncbi:unnamed protein product [Chrysodeixis includens]|uniref:Uncharacterized protein n=1 Tax=Chrysodeixis includens TaxID=689277 RepID=A0A9N8KWL8_CHRIL|nr:unnamed protein product [Chrysodeixis includens]
MAARAAVVRGGKVKIQKEHIEIYKISNFQNSRKTFQLDKSFLIFSPILSPLLDKTNQTSSHQWASVTHANGSATTETAWYGKRGTLVTRVSTQTPKNYARQARQWKYIICENFSFLAITVYEIQPGDRQTAEA